MERQSKILHYILVIAAYIALVVLQMSDCANDPGLGWHLKTGEIIAAGNIPRQDPFLYSVQPRLWISDQWLSDYVLFSLYRIGSWPLLYGFLSILFIATFVFLLPNTVQRRKNVSAIVLCLSALFALKMASMHFIIRPVVFSFLLFTYTLRFIYLRETKTLFLIFPVLFALWSNLHPSFILGLLLMAIHIASMIMEAAAQRSESINSKRIAAWVILLFFSFAATLINPYGYHLHSSIFSLAQSNFFTNLNSEWRALSLDSPEGNIFLITLLVVAACALFRRSFWQNIRSFDIAVVLFFSYAATNSVRYLPYFAIVSAYPFCLALQTLISQRADSVKFAYPGIIALVILMLLIGGIPLYRGEFGPSKNLYPFQSLQYLKSIPTQSVVFSTPDWGGFITYFGEGRVRPVIDDRNTLLGEQIYKDYLSAIEGENWRALAKSLGANYALLPARSTPAQMLSEHKPREILFSEGNGLAVVVAVK